MSELEVRPARLSEREALAALMDAAIDALLGPVLTPEQLAASRAVMGLDTLLIEDGTYYTVEIGGVLAGCGGWSRRATLYGGDHTGGRTPELLDPTRDAARVRAMYTAPEFSRRGVGRAILAASEAAAGAEGFRTAELASTLAGLPLYEAAGYRIVRSFEDDRGGHPVPLHLMSKAL